MFANRQSGGATTVWHTSHILAVEVGVTVMAELAKQMDSARGNNCNRLTIPRPDTE